MASEGKVWFGISHVVYALDDDGAVGDEWKELPGARTLTVEAENSQNNFYADNMIYWVSSTSSSSTFTLELARVTDEAMHDLFGYTDDAVSGLTLQAANVQFPTFTLGYQYEGDTDTLRGVKYGCTFTQFPENHTTTEDSTEPDTVTIDGSIAGKTFTLNNDDIRVVGGYCSNAGTTHAAYDAFYLQPPVPGAAPAAA